MGQKKLKKKIQAKFHSTKLKKNIFLLVGFYIFYFSGVQIIFFSLKGPTVILGGKVQKKIWGKKKDIINFFAWRTGLVWFGLVRLNSRHVCSRQNLPKFQTQGYLGSGIKASKQQIVIIP